MDIALVEYEDMISTITSYVNEELSYENNPRVRSVGEPVSMWLWSDGDSEPFEYNNGCKSIQPSFIVQG